MPFPKSGDWEKAFKVVAQINAQRKRFMAFYFAKATARVSRMTVIFTCPG